MDSFTTYTMTLAFWVLDTHATQATRHTHSRRTRTHPPTQRTIFFKDADDPDDPLRAKKVTLLID